LKFWFHNNTRGSSSGGGTRGILKLSPPPKLVHPWQAYLNKFQTDRLKEPIDDAWEDYIKGVPDGEAPKKTQFEVRNKVAQRLYEDETPEIKQEVEEHRQKMKEDGSITDIDNPNQAFQRYFFSRDEWHLWLTSCHKQLD
jgi:hypothetical protein